MNIKDLFYLQRNDRQAVVAVCSVILIALGLVIFVGHSSSPSPSSLSSSGRQTDRLRVGKSAGQHSPVYYKTEGELHELFPFDPNTADSSQLLRLGLEPWQVRSIYRYRAKGGVYRHPTDFAQLYGLTKQQYETLAPYIRIADDFRPASEFYHRERGVQRKGGRQGEDFATNDAVLPADKRTFSYQHKLSAGEHVDVNSADTTELQKIPGIGSGYSRAIVRYRRLLGGFVSAQQLLEIDGVPEGVLAFVTVDASKVRKMNINKLSLNQLHRHPYINFYQAQAICNYRRLQGPIHDLQELSLLKDFPQQEIDRLRAYVEY